MCRRRPSRGPVCTARIRLDDTVMRAERVVIPLEPDMAVQAQMGLADRYGRAGLYEQAAIWLNRAAHDHMVYSATYRSAAAGLAESARISASPDPTRQAMPRAQFLLALHYAFGCGVKQDLEKAYNWLSVSIARGFQPAGGWPVVHRYFTPDDQVAGMFKLERISCGQLWSFAPNL